ncbi:MAG TPA: transglutaminase domain-containing protein [Candidatus Acidoferrum sp.]|nr:transglutaminase domain-containing protein [Candidatus Acidoferrum sp.]
MRIVHVFFILAVAWLAASAFGTPGDTLKSIALPSGYTLGLAWDGHYLWSSDRRTDMLYKFDPADGHVLDSIPAPGYFVTGLTFDGKLLWCADADTPAKLYAVNPNTRLVEHTMDSPIDQPAGLAWDGTYLWMADPGGGKIHQVDPSDGTTILSLTAPTKNPGGMTYDGRYLWVTDRYRDEIYMVTKDKGDVIITFNSPGQYPSGLAWDGTNLWSADYQTDRCYRLVIDDGITFSQKDKRSEQIEFVHQVRNFGPDSIVTLQVYVAIPHDLNNQKLLAEPTFEPKPAEILTDKWGQQVARFEFKNIPVSSQSSVTMRVPAELYKVRYFVYPEKVGKLEDIPADIRSKYLVDDIKFSYNSPIIQKAVKEAVGDEKNPYWIARKVYNYCIEHLEYQLSGGWNTAPTVLERGNGSCSEYTFVYIAMCRAAGLPARYVGSVVHRGDDACWDDVYHRWVEVYLPKYGWIPVDPSGGDGPIPQGRAAYFGQLDNRFVITTIGGGGSEYMDWTYNGNEKWVSKGKCRVVVEQFAEWTPLATKK